MQKKYKVILLFMSLFFISNCQSQIDALKQIGKVPQLAKVSIPMLDPNYEPIDWEEPLSPFPSALLQKNSLWNKKSRFFLQDTNPKRVGDIIKVTISIDDEAELDNTTFRSRKSNDSGKNPIALGVEKVADNILPFGLNPLGAVSINSDSQYTGDGNIEREETISTQVAAMITQILPNGNLVIHGDQEISVNYEIRKVSIDGIIQPQDISVNNSISSEQVAQARILYGGRGNLSTAQQPRVGNQLLDIFSPF